MAHQHKVGVPSKPTNASRDALSALSADIVSSLPSSLPHAQPPGIITALPKRGTIKEALQGLLKATNCLMEEFVQTCKLAAQGTHHNLQQSSMNIAKSLERFDRRELHLIADAGIIRQV